MIEDRVFVSCDTKCDPDLLEIYKHAECFFHDVQFFPGAVHAYLDELREKVPDDIKKRMHLMHYADNWRDQDITGFAGWTKQGVKYNFG